MCCIVLLTNKWTRNHPCYTAAPLECVKTYRHYAVENVDASMPCKAATVNLDM